MFSGSVLDEHALAVFETAMKPLVDHRARYRRLPTSKDGELLEGDSKQDGDELNGETLDLDEPLPMVDEA